MSKFSKSVSGSESRLSLWERFVVWFSGWYFRSPLPASPPPSATLVPDEEPKVELAPEVVRSLARFDDLAEGLISGHIKGFVVFADAGVDVPTFWLTTTGSNHEMMALAIKDYGHKLHLKVARSQGNAPPENRSDTNQ